MANRKKQEDKNLKILRELVGQQNNKKCFDCGQRGPTYVNMTVGVFVCTSCSGLLRGLNPPHRIKSISMATFSAAEITFLRAHGNEVCRGTWLALWDSSHPPEPESREEQKVKDFLIKKYERKVWFSDKPKQRPVQQSIPEAKPLKHLLGENSQELQVNTSVPAATSVQHVERPVAQPAAPTAQPPTAQQVKQPKVDLLADLGGDPFGSSSNPQNSSQGFAAFQSQPPQQDMFGQAQQHPFGDDAFASQPQKQPPFGGQPTPFAAQAQQSNQSNQSMLINTSDPFGAVTPPASSSSISFNAFGQSSSNVQASSSGNVNFFEQAPQLSSANAFNQSAPSSVPGGVHQGDKYKILSELDDVFRGSNTQSIFSSTSSASNVSTANQQPNPFMSPASGTSGVAMFQQQQQKAPNPFQSGQNAGQSQPTSWGMMPAGQPQGGMQSVAMQRNQQQFGQQAFNPNQQQQQQQAFGSNQPGGFANANQAGFAQSGFGGNQAGGMQNQMPFSNQVNKMPQQQQPMQNQMPGGMPQTSLNQQQQYMFNSPQHQQQQHFNGQQQGFPAQQAGQQFMAAQQGGFGGQQMQGFQGQMQGQMPGQMQGQMPGQMQGQMPGQMPGQMSGQMSNQMQGQMPGQMQGQMPGQMQGQKSNQMPGQMPGGFGNQQTQQFGTWNQTSNKGVGNFGMAGFQTGAAQKSTNPFM